MIYLFGCLFSIAFALIYYALFHVILQEEQTTLTLYYNQVGLYKSEDNAQSAISTLKNQAIEAYLFPQEDVNAVICGLSTTEAQTKENGTALASLDMNYIEKTILIQNPACIKALEEQDFTTALELITNESKTDEQNGAAS